MTRGSPYCLYQCTRLYGGKGGDKSRECDRIPDSTPTKRSDTIRRGCPCAKPKGEGRSEMKGHARQFMTAKVVIASPETSLAEATHLLAQVEISGLPVVDADGQVVGIVTESDLLNALLGPTSVETPISTLMTTPVVTVDEFTPADSIIRLLRERRFHHLPVTRQGVVVGLITPQDVIRYFVEHELPLPPEVA